MTSNTIHLSCPDCGSESISRPADFNFETNFNGVSCADCGRSITKDDAINQGRNVVKKQVDDIIRDAFKGSAFKLK
ncbi:ECs_2282 family putative zinc-binding protein [Serratia fonticola]